MSKKTDNNTELEKWKTRARHWIYRAKVRNTPSLLGVLGFPCSKFPCVAHASKSFATIFKFWNVRIIFVLRLRSCMSQVNYRCAGYVKTGHYPHAGLASEMSVIVYIQIVNDSQPRYLLHTSDEDCSALNSEIIIVQILSLLQTNQEIDLVKTMFFMCNFRGLHERPEMKQSFSFVLSSDVSKLRSVSGRQN